MMHQHRRAGAALAIACFSAVLCLQGLLAPKSENYMIDVEELEHETQLHRYLLQKLDYRATYYRDWNEYGLPTSTNQEDLAKLDPKAEDESPIGTRHLSPFLASLSSYTLEDAMAEADPFKNTFAVMVYDPDLDTFLGYYSKNHVMRISFYKLSTSMKIFALMLRKSFPERFTPSSDEFAVAISSGDYPTLDISSLPHFGVAPVLHFGSVLDEDLYLNMIAMPMLGLQDAHLKCFGEWSSSQKVCNWLQPLRHGESEMPKRPGGLPFGKELGLEWENLKPQLIWRGSDFSYLTWLVKTMSRPHIGSLANVLEQEDDKQHAAAVEVLRQSYDKLIPRWQGVVLTAEAELAAQEGELPWANIKFAKGSSRNAEMHEKFEEVGVSVVDDYMSIEDQAHFKYLIDIGGGGGTTWTGTTYKLAMPGLLFHHITPTKDYFHDRIKPYVHYVPVAPDLSDLKEKYDWAESNPEQAKKIADGATEFMRHLGTPEGFGRLYQEDFVEPLRKIIEAYQPVSTTHPGKTWKDILEPSEGSNNMVRVLECEGLSTRRSCKGDRGVDDGMVQEWMKSRRTYQDRFADVQSTRRR